MINRPALVLILLSQSLLPSVVQAATVTFAAIDPVFIANGNAVPLGSVVQSLIFYGPTGTTGVEGAEEVASPPGANQGVGDILTFLNGPVDFELTSGQDGGFVWNDLEAQPTDPMFADSLSVGDIDDWQDDNFRILFLQDDVYGVAFQVIDNATYTTESISVELVNGEVFSIGTFDAIVAHGTVPGYNDTYGIMSTGSAIRHVFFNEDSGSDDIALRSISAVTIGPVVPIPPAVWLFGSALGLMGVMRRKLTS